MNFATRLSLVTAGVLSLAICAVVATALRGGLENARARRQAELAAVGLLMRDALDRSSAFALAQAESLARQPEVRRALAQRDRPGLAERLGETFAYLRGEAGVELMQFQDADMRILVRLQDVERFGDAASGRPMVIAANRSGRSQRGVEIGPTGVLALRGIAPILLEGKLVGSAEVGLDMRPLLQAIKAATDAEAAVVLSAAMTQTGRGAAGDVVVQGSTDDRLFGALVANPEFRLARERIQFESVIGADRYAVVNEPLLDFSGRMIGGVVAARNVNVAARAFNREALILGFIGAVGLILAFSVVTVSVRAFLLRPIEAMALYAERLAGGERPAAPPSIGGAREVARAARAFGALAEAAGAPPAAKP
ncbi:cache domain-containing protein [Alsobacter sp. KACC 23698]|uniref:Cache domain-containing protein n=1 Tax=Alsobacter sp. KACC 23698 TaxID=3149229 RepID=A0AAU7JCY2_9HYPH